MSKVRIKTLWFWRKGETSPELLTAWDTYSVDANPRGFDEACRAAFGDVQSDDAGVGPRRIDILADWEPIEDAFAILEAEAMSEVV